jgi:hypothetical protein
MRRALWALFLVAAAVAIVTVAIPTLYIQPFKPQRPEMLARAYALRQAAPTVTAACLPIVIVSALALVWLGTLRPKRSTPVLRQSTTPAAQNVGAASPARRQRSIRARVAGWGLSRSGRFRYVPPVVRGLTLVVLVGLTSLVTWFCRQNHFEWMFAPPAEVTYVSVPDASKFLTPDEMVMGIEVAGLSLAYPIRQMAYHHVVNDMFGTTPVVVTY